MKFRCLGSGSSGNAYTLSDGVTEVLIEAGFPFHELLRRLNFQLPKSCFLTHEHGDHSKAVKNLVKHGVDIFASAGTFEKVGVPASAETLLKHGEVKTVGTLNVMPFNVEHDAQEPLGFVFASKVTGDCFLFATDTYFVRPRFANLTQIAIECNFDREEIDEDINDKYIERAMESHLSLQDLLILLKSNDISKVREIYILHISSHNAIERKIIKEIQENFGIPVYTCKKEGGFNEDVDD